MIDFLLRQMRPTDSPALTTLVQDMSDGPGLGMTTLFQIDTYQALIHADHHQTVGVVAEVEGFDPLAGMATVRFGETVFEGQVRPGAYLANLKVHPQFRQQGLGWQLAQWRVNRALDTFGEDGVIMTGMLTTNAPSRATARKWCHDFFEPVHVAIGYALDKPPQAEPGLSIRQATPAELETAASQQNAFYQDYNFYEPVTAASLTSWLQYTPTSAPINTYYVAVNQAGDILAGTAITERQQVMVDQFNNPPPPLRALLPDDLIMREWQVRTIWYAPRQLTAAQALWQELRWLCRESATVVTGSYDPRGPLGAVYQVQAEGQPDVEIAFAVRGPVPLNPERLVASTGR